MGEKDRTSIPCSLVCSQALKFTGGVGEQPFSNITFVQRTINGSVTVI